MHPYPTMLLDAYWKYLHFQHFKPSRWHCAPVAYDVLFLYIFPFKLDLKKKKNALSSPHAERLQGASVWTTDN